MASKNEDNRHEKRKKDTLPKWEGVLFISLAEVAVSISAPSHTSAVVTG